MLRRRRPFAGDASILGERVVRFVARHSADGEVPIACLRGRWDQSLIVFDDRIMIVKPRLFTGAVFGARLTTLYIRDISGIHVASRLVNGSIELTTAAFPRARRREVDEPQHRRPNCIPVRRRRLPLYEPVLAELRVRISAAKASPAQGEQPERLLSELERLGALRLTGILSHTEFERAKRLLLEPPEAA